MTAMSVAGDVMRRTLPAPVAATYVFLGLGVAAPLLFTTVGTPPGNELADWLIITTLVIAAGRYAWIVGSRERHLYEMVLWLFVYFFFGLAPLVQTRLTWPSTTPNPEPTMVTEAATAALVAVVAASFGSFFARRPPRPENFLSDAAPTVRGDRTVLLAVVALALSAVYVMQVGPASLFSARVDLATAQGASFGDNLSGLFVRAGSVFGLLTAFVALRLLRAQRRAAGERYPRLLTFVVLVTLILLANPINSSRYLSGTVLLAILAALGIYSTVGKFRAVAIGAVTGMLVLFPLLDTFRNSLSAQVRLATPVDALLSGDFDAFAQIVNSLEYIATMGITWGNQALGVILFWVPRAVWPGKADDTGIVLAEFKNYGFTNLSAPLPAELLMNFGWPALFIGMLLLGFLLRRLDHRAELQLQATPIPPVLGCILPFYLLLVLRGSLLQATANLAAILLFSWFVTARGNDRSEVSRTRRNARVGRLHSRPS